MSILQNLIGIETKVGDLPDDGRFDFEKQIKKLREDMNKELSNKSCFEEGIGSKISIRDGSDDQIIKNVQKELALWKRSYDLLIKENMAPSFKPSEHVGSVLLDNFKDRDLLDTVNRNINGIMSAIRIIRNTYWDSATGPALDPLHFLISNDSGRLFSFLATTISDIAKLKTNEKKIDRVISLDDYRKGVRGARHGAYISTKYILSKWIVVLEVFDKWLIENLDKRLNENFDEDYRNRLTATFIMELPDESMIDSRFNFLATKYINKIIDTIYLSLKGVSAGGRLPIRASKRQYYVFLNKVTACERDLAVKDDHLYYKSMSSGKNYWDINTVNKSEIDPETVDCSKSYGRIFYDNDLFSLSVERSLYGTYYSSDDSLPKHFQKFIYRVADAHIVPYLSFMSVAMCRNELAAQREMYGQYVISRAGIQSVESRRILSVRKVFSRIKFTISHMLRIQQELPTIKTMIHERTNGFPDVLPEKIIVIRVKQRRSVYIPMFLGVDENWCPCVVIPLDPATKEYLERVYLIPPTDRLIVKGMICDMFSNMSAESSQKAFGGFVCGRLDRDIGNTSLTASSTFFLGEKSIVDIRDYLGTPNESPADRKDLFVKYPIIFDRANEAIMDEIIFQKDKQNDS